MELAGRFTAAAQKEIEEAKDKLMDNAAGATINIAGQMALGLLESNMTYQNRIDQERRRRQRGHRDNTGGVWDNVKLLLVKADESLVAARERDSSILADAFIIPQMPDKTNSKSGFADELFNAPITDFIHRSDLEDIYEALASAASIISVELPKWRVKFDAKREERKAVEEQLRMADEELFQLRSHLMEREILKQYPERPKSA